ncbi:Rgg/GadR/MutR family transcriptional regulator [Sporolactobacillus shoreae]|uniref:Rgg/GadR/MutR family transcriptional regulator n=1 Tax=Sporolactobacillus shoreae TaxID=1465501 RepID=A0A4Z0GL57_9BACL|nr:Rgg/GadR/MutR family transcriptional regulator [Sporolactobacillus shoreae]TGA96743.1 Rgg/GadR/MutR family transcriptional regulator [Sporolactobacillus shoreae]
MAYQLGEVLKKIRESKKYTQKYVSDNHMSRTTYAKIEACTMEPTVGKFMHILQKLDISYDELKYIQNMYSLEGKEEIIHDFFQVSTSVETSKFFKLKKSCEQYLINHSDSVVDDIRSICIAQLIIQSENDYKKAHIHASKVWERLSKLDDWYTIELKLINNIFFFFPLETGISIAQKALKEINKFSFVEKINELKPAYLLNMALLMINNLQFSEAHHFSEKAIHECDLQKRYDLISVAHARKGVALINLGKNSEGIASIKKAIAINKALDQTQMINAILEEVRQKTDISISF